MSRGAGDERHESGAGDERRETGNGMWEHRVTRQRVFKKNPGIVSRVTFSPSRPERVNANDAAGAQL